MRSERENGFGEPEIFENFGGNLVIAAGGLKEQETTGVRGVLQAFAIGEPGKEMHQIFEAFGANHGFIFRIVTGSPKFDTNARGIKLAIFLQLRDGAEKGLRIAFDGIQQTHVDETDGPG